MDGDQVDWVALAKQGDSGAMHELYERNRGRIYSLAYRYAGNSADAEDILQESFAKAFVSLAKCQLNENTYFASWLYRIAVNCTMDHFRRRRGPNDAVTLDELPGPASDGAETPEGEFARREARELVRHSLSRLPRRRRMAVVLRHYQQMKIAEIAVAMGCSEGCVKKQLFQALRQLRRELHPSLGGSR
ncbi:MAG: RNA polymerase sigma factor [Candidatus Aminicenantes bacterium]|nr:RNA polymerase sigma factor [Candidatus Aminicenantes bacterium]